jgi:preprotein translocase subunit SecE
MIITLSVLLIVTAIVVIYYFVDFYIRGGVQVIKDDW